MQSVKNLVNLVLLGGFFGFFFFLLLKAPSVDYDSWYHIKVGEEFTQHGLSFYDVFSHTAANRFWIPSDWLFEVLIYRFTNIFGINYIKYFIAFFSLFQLVVLYILMRKIFGINGLFSLALCFIYLTFNYSFSVGRPQIVSTLFLLINLTLLLLYFVKDKNFLWISLPITLIWSNTHSTIILDVYLFFAFTFLSFVNYRLSKELLWRKKAKILLFFSICTFILTILPPLWFLQYEFLYLNMKYLPFLKVFISEMIPLWEFPLSFYIYTLITIALLLGYAVAAVKSKNIYRALWVLALVPFILNSYTSVRYMLYGKLVLVIIWGYQMQFFNWKNMKKWQKITASGIAVTVFVLTYMQLQINLSQSNYNYPEMAAKFIKKENIKGNMFNEFDYGGYLLYMLYPEHKVFVDNRGHVYFCCELKTLENLKEQVFLPDSQYNVLLNQVWNQYKISYVIVNPKKTSYTDKIAGVLTNDPNWQLVFWDDKASIFIKKDGLNDRILSKYGVEAATPYAVEPFKKDKMDEAQEEYQKMIGIADSARSRNGLGVILAKQNRSPEAEAEFAKAIRLDNTFDSPYLNWEQIALKNGDMQKANMLNNIIVKLLLNSESSSLNPFGPK